MKCVHAQRCTRAYSLLLLAKRLTLQEEPDTSLQMMRRSTCPADKLVAKTIRGLRDRDSFRLRGVDRTAKISVRVAEQYDTGTRRPVVRMTPAERSRAIVIHACKPPCLDSRIFFASSGLVWILSEAYDAIKKRVSMWYPWLCNLVFYSKRSESCPFSPFPSSQPSVKKRSGAKNPRTKPCTRAV